jgi:hypothetical protein
MKRLLSLLAGILLAAGLCACGGASAPAGSSSSISTSAHTSSSAAASELSPAPLDSKTDGDRDNDIGAPYDDTNNSRAFSFGRAASSSERQAITALVKRYYTTALAGDGARGCAMIYSTLAEAAPQDDGLEAGAPAYMHGAKTCAAVLTSLFRHYHAQLAAELPKLKVTRVRLEEHHGFAFLSFGALPERKISVLREKRIWKLDQIYDQELP